MTRTITRVAVAAMGVSVAMGLGSCIDEDYDLSKDIDMTVQIGSEGFTLPASDTEPYTLSQILNLDETSSIKCVKAGQYGLAEGDYVLVQSGESEPSTVEIEKIALDGLEGSTTETPLDEFRFFGDGRVTVDVDGAPTQIKIEEDNVTRELVSLKSAETAVYIEFEIGFRSNDYSGNVIIEQGFKALFDPSWTLEVRDAATASFLRMENGNTAVFTREMAVNTASTITVRLLLTNVDLAKAPGQGLIEPGHFRLECDVKTIGQVSIDGTGMQPGQTANLDLVTTTRPTDAELLAITGVVDPKIDIEPTIIHINDIPDFLASEENVLDVENPRISFSVYNSSPVSINLNAVLRAVDKNGSSRIIGLGNENSTDPIVIAADRTTDFVISRKPIALNGAENIVVPDLGELIKTIPDQIYFEDIKAKALPQEVTMVLGTAFDYECNYEAVIPLAFGADLKLHYTHEELDWDEDLHKYNFNQVLITVDVINTLPVNLAPSVLALDRNGNEITNIIAEVEGMAAAGTVDSPAVSPLKITLRSEAANLGELDGVRLVFDGTTDAAHVGENLNKAQSVEFDNVLVKIIGGVTIDLND